MNDIHIPKKKNGKRVVCLLLLIICIVLVGLNYQREKIREKIQTYQGNASRTASE